MKSTHTYDMHNYAATSLPNISNSIKSIKKCAKNTNNNNNNNNNSVKDIRIEKYSLRQRQKRKYALEKSDESTEYGSDRDDQDSTCSTLFNNTSNSCLNSVTTNISNASHAMPTTNAMKQQQSTAISNSKSMNSSKPKTKAAPLSKYRRKTANARERTRMREINTAFENLRHCVPHTITGDDSGQTNEKLTKITTLRLAMKYIGILSEALVNPTFEANFLLACKNDGDDRFITFQNQTFDYASESETIPKTPQSNSNAKGKSRTSKTLTSKASLANGACKTRTTAKRITKRQKQKIEQIDTPYRILSTDSSESNSIGSGTTVSPCTSLSGASYSSSSASSMSSLSPTTSISAVHKNTETLSSPQSNKNSIINNKIIQTTSRLLPSSKISSDVTSLILESDSESLHLSDNCLSPLRSNYTNLLDSVHDIAMATLENPLELSLRLLESSSGDSMDFSVEQSEPSTSCISPLVSLDPYNPFNDFIHNDFTEHTSLDLFLT